MAVIKVFDAKGVKTVQMMGNLNEQDYETPVVEMDADTEDSESAD